MGNMMMMTQLLEPLLLTLLLCSWCRCSCVHPAEQFDAVKDAGVVKVGERAVSEGAGSGGGHWHAMLRSLQHQQHLFSLIRALIIMGVACALLVM
jgi:hypothetical protein